MRASTSYALPRRLPPLYEEPRLPRLWERLVVAATAFVLLLMIAEALARDSASLTRWLFRADVAASAILFIDFVARVVLARDRIRFLKDHGWELLGCVPLAPMHLARLGRVARILRLSRHAPGRIAAMVGGLASRFQNVGRIAIVAAVVWLLSAALMYRFEGDKNPTINSMDDALWWSMTTLSTVGYGDTYPQTTAGRVVAMMTMVVGVGVLGALAGTMATLLLDLREHGRRGLGNYRMKDHLLVLGWNDKAFAAVDDFRRDERRRDTPVCIVADLPMAPIESDAVTFVRGKPIDAEALRRASADRAAAVVIFARDPKDPQSDLETIITVHALRRINTDARVSAELVDAQHHEHLIAAGCDAVVDGALLSSLLLIRSVQDAGIVEIVTDLVSAREGSEIYRVPVPQDFVGKAVRELARAAFERRQTVLALIRGAAVLPNPEPGEVLLESDEVFLVASEPPRS